VFNIQHSQHGSHVMAFIGFILMQSSLTIWCAQTGLVRCYTMSVTVPWDGCTHCSPNSCASSCLPVGPSLQQNAVAPCFAVVAIFHIQCAHRTYTGTFHAEQEKLLNMQHDDSGCSSVQQDTDRPADMQLTHSTDTCGG
jgi:hypothetical protein